MKLLGAILAGGQSRRFGSDKAAALADGKALIDHVADALRPQVAALVVAGRSWLGLDGVTDSPEPNIGPLGGLAGALAHARRYEFDAVLSCGCDVLGLPDDLAAQLSPGPAIVGDLPIVGLWPTHAEALLIEWLANPANRSVYAFADCLNARQVALAQPLRNVNRPSDLAPPESPR